MSALAVPVRREPAAPAPAGPRVGMVGGGQLARMTHAAAIPLALELAVLEPGADAPAVGAGARHCAGSPERLEDLRRLARGCDVITLDHERTPFEHLEALERAGHVVRPGPAAARAAQDKLHARRLLGELGFPVPAYAPVGGAGDVARFAERHGWPLMLKAARGGYDGRGVHEVRDPEGAAALLGQGGRWLAEERVGIDAELAVLVARRPGGSCAVYPVTETLQVDGICRELLAPARVPAAVAEEAARMAVQIAEAVDATGVLAVELFLSGGRLLVNELAARPHNSGHWTLDGAVTSQFENHLRAVLDLPLGDPAARAPATAMVNVLGPDDGSDPAARRREALAIPGARVHLYGKAPRPGRKLGHVTALADAPDAALAVARHAAAALEGRA